MSLELDLPPDLESELAAEAGVLEPTASPASLIATARLPIRPPGKVPRSYMPSVEDQINACSPLTPTTCPWLLMSAALLEG